MVVETIEAKAPQEEEEVGKNPLQQHPIDIYVVYSELKEVFY